MTTREEIVWLFRCILGRDPESEETIDGMIRRCPDFMAARRDILSSSELRGKQRRDNPALARNHKLSTISFVRLVDRQLGGGMAQETHLNVPDASISAERAAIPDAVFNQIRRRLNAKLVLLFGELDDNRWLINLVAKHDGTERWIAVVSVPVPGEEQPPHDSCAKASNGTGNFDVGSTHIFHIRVTLGWEVVLPLFSMIGIEPELVVVSSSHARHVRAILPHTYDAIHNSGLVLVRFDRGETDEIKHVVSTLLKSVFHRDEIIAGNLFLVQKWEWFVPLTQTSGVAWGPTTDNAPFPEPALPGKLAVACIVRDEENFVRTMLNSCVPIAAYFVIVDTGSKDTTLDVVRNTLLLTGRPFEIIETEFVEFSSARNVAIDNMPSWIDWILMMDADEHLVVEDFERFADLMSGECDAWMLPRYNFFDEAKTIDPGPYPDRQRRLFRNYPDHRVRYFGAVHEGLVGARNWGVAPSNLAALGMGEGGPHIHHMGRVGRSDEEKLRKTELYARLKKVMPTRS